MALPVYRGKHKSAHTTTLSILRRFEFESSLMRSGVVCTDSGGPPGSALLFVRGAPSTVEQLVGTGRIPADFRQVMLSHDSVITRFSVNSKY